MSRNETVELRIEKVVYGGDGLARLEAEGGRRQVVFVPMTLPGELVRAELEPGNGGQLRARLLEVIEPAAGRVAPGCEYYGRCGGCQLQHASVGLQLEMKRDVLIETLQRTGGVQWTGAVPLHAGEPWGYRNRIRMQRAGRGWGYLERGSHRVLPVTHCPIASPQLNRELEAATAAPRVGEELELAVNNREEGRDGAESLFFEMGGFRYRVGPESFFQVNRFLTPKLVEVVTGGESGETAVDLYSGVGLFALPLGRRFARLTAVESHAPAVADLRHNLETAGLEAVRVRAADAAAYWRDGGREVDLLVADPPRAGLGPDLVKALSARPPKKLHLVSCDPATLGRDLRGLLAAGYQIAELHLFDLFPQTYHLETVVRLRR
ncbi:MAG TPA: TRAM domain-containing protein [Terriglobales bacterium]|nr:TRAM domain-containing protein [Terriglobales bacterium]